MFSIPGVEFAYSQAPVSMKSIVMSYWLLSTSIGNLMVVAVEGVLFFERAVSICINNGIGLFL